ncbi:hypothetical protein HELRODRAFT_192406, partial [Helobdella robusta]
LIVTESVEEEILNRIGTMPADTQYELLKNMQDAYFDEVTGYNLARNISLKEDGIDRVRMTYTDRYIEALARSRRYRLPYFSHKFLHKDCPVCKKEFVEGKFVHTLHCGHALHFH